MRSVYLLILLLPYCLFSGEPNEKRVLNFLILDDVRSACDEGEKLVRQYSDSETCWEVYLQALAKRGEPHLMLKAWDQFVERFPDRSEDRFLLESMAWGIIENNAGSRSPIIRSYALLGAFYGQDARGVKIIRNGYKDPNVAIRTLSVKMSGFLRDDSLQKEVLKLLKDENNLQVRLEAIQTAGKMKIAKAEPYLLKTLQSSRSRAEEKFMAGQALVSLYDQLTLAQVKTLVGSRRAALRELACRVVLHTDMKEAVSVIAGLLNDSSPDVKCAALETVGFFHEEQTPELVGTIRQLAKDPHPKVSISASWALMFSDAEMAYQSLRPHLEGNHRDYQLLAGAALVSSGQFGSHHLGQAFDQTDEEYLKMNLALGMIVNGCRVEESCRSLVSGFINDRDQWMWKQQGIFRFLAPSDVKHVPWIPNHPEMVNQMTRLEIINVLAIKESPGALDVAKNFLSRRQWGISGMASSLLLQEGNESAIELVQSLLSDPSSRVRVQAALILAMWGGDEGSVEELQNSYHKSDRELKERILEGLGNVGSKHSLPFLTQRLGDPQPSLRVIAAASLLQCLYH